MCHTETSGGGLGGGFTPQIKRPGTWTRRNVRRNRLSYVVFATKSRFVPRLQERQKVKERTWGWVGKTLVPVRFDYTGSVGVTGSGLGRFILCTLVPMGSGRLGFGWVVDWCLRICSGRFYWVWTGLVWISEYSILFTNDIFGTRNSTKQCVVNDWLCGPLEQMQRVVETLEVSLICYRKGLVGFKYGRNSLSFLNLSLDILFFYDKRVSVS